MQAMTTSVVHDSGIASRPRAAAGRRVPGGCGRSGPPSLYDRLIVA